MTSPTDSKLPESANAETTEAWDGPLYDRFVRFREIVTSGLGAHGEEALRRFPPSAGERVLDIGCGFGDTTQRLAGLVGDEGEVVGVDVAPRFIETARTEAAAAGAKNVSFAVGGRRNGRPGGSLRAGVLALRHDVLRGPVVALRNVRRALAPGGWLVMVVWRRREDNDWLYRAQRTVEGIVERPQEYDEPTCGPGPFSMADADTTSEILVQAGYREISLSRCDLPIRIGNDVDEAIELMMALGPAGEILRLAGERAADRHEEVRSALLAEMSNFAGPDGLRAGASTWIVAARAPEAGS